MAQFSLPNITTGGSQTITANTLADAETQAQQAGTWNPGAGTYGAGSTLGGGTGGSQMLPGAGLGGDLSGLQAFAAATSGVTQAQLAQQKAEFDAQLNFARDQMTQLGIPQLQINQFLAQMQQQQFQSQLALATQAQAYNQAATTAGLTGYYTPPQGVPNMTPYTNQQTWQPGQAGLQNPGQLNVSQASAAGGGPMSWNQLSQQLQSQAGANYNDAAGKAAFLAATGGDPANFNGGASVNLTPAQIQSILSAGSNGLLGGGAGALPAQGTTGAGAQPGGTAANPFSMNWWPGQSGGSMTPGAPPGSQMTMQLGQMLGEFNGMPTEQATEFARNLALQQGQLGQQYLSTAAQLQGPQNTFQLSNYLRGAQGNPNVPVYLQNLANNIGMPAFQAQGTTAPTTQTAAGLAGQLGGQQSATPGWDYNQTLGTIQQIMNRGAQSLGPGALERLSPDELQAFGSGLGAAGGSLPSFMQQYQQSRVGQQAPVAQTSLA